MAFDYTSALLQQRAPLHDVENMKDRADEMFGRAGQTAANMQPSSKTETEEAGHSVGGGISSAMGGAVSGAMVGSVVPGVGTAVGAIGGTVLGTAAYFLS
jgi:phage tail tape-measure protein